MAGIGQSFQILHCPEFFLDFTEVGHRIPAVRTSLCRIQKRHQMDIVYITLLQIVQPTLHTFQISCKIVNIHHHSDNIVSAEPVRLLFPLFIPLFQLLFPLLIISIHFRAQFSKHIRVFIQFHVEPSQFVMVPFQPFLKYLIRFCHFSSPPFLLPICVLPVILFLYYSLCQAACPVTFLPYPVSLSSQQHLGVLSRLCSNRKPYC